MSMLRPAILLLGSVGVGLGAACQHAAKPLADEGRSSIAFVDAAKTRPKPQLSLAKETMPQTLAVAARPLEPLAKPIFPAAARNVKGELALVGVRIVVGPDGRVADIGPSLVCFSTPGPFAADFRAAVEAAVAQWKFVPAERQVLERVTLADGSNYWRAAENKKVEAVFDVAFTFSADGTIASSEIR